MASRLEWVKDSDGQTLRAIGNWNLRVRTALFKLCQAWAPFLEAEMKAKAPWKDRTGNARKTLNAKVFGHPAGQGAFGVNLSHGVEYGVYLELGNDGRWGITRKTMEANQSDFMESIRRLTGE